MSSLQGPDPSPIEPAPPTELAGVYFAPPPMPAHFPQKIQAVDFYDKHNLCDEQTAQVIGRIFTAVYSNGEYPCAVMTNPDTYIGELAKGSFVSLVARDSAGVPIGHAAILNLGAGNLIPNGDKVAELGKLFVDPARRARGLGDFLIAVQLNKAQDLYQTGELALAYADTVTSHSRSQWLFAKHDAAPTGIFDRKYTDFFGQGHRESILRLGIILDEGIRDRRQVFLPQDFEEVANYIYGLNHCDREITSAPPSVAHQVPADSGVWIDYSELADFGCVTFMVGAGRPPASVTADAAAIFALGAAHVSAKVDLSDPACLGQIDALRKNGFYFAAVETYPSGDYIFLQKLNDSLPPGFCPEVQEMVPEHSMELLEMCRKLRPGP